MSSAHVSTQSASNSGVRVSGIPPMSSFDAIRGTIDTWTIDLLLMPLPHSEA